MDYNKNRELQRKTKIGLVSRIYDSQKTRCKKKGFEMPTYSISELRKYIFSCENFDNLHEKWKKSGYKRNLKPSIDRIDDNKSYTLDNIQLMSWEDNRKKSFLDIMNGNNRKTSIAIVRIDNEGNCKDYYSTKQACRENDANCGAIWAVCNNRKKTHKGFIWKYKVGR